MYFKKIPPKTQDKKKIAFFLSTKICFNFTTKILVKIKILRCCFWWWSCKRSFVQFQPMVLLLPCGTQIQINADGMSQLQ